MRRLVPFQLFPPIRATRLRSIITGREAAGISGRQVGTALAVLLVAALAGGCATVESVKDAKGQGVKRSYRQPYDLVYQAAVNAAHRRKLEFVEQDRAAGLLVLSSGVSWTSLGERIAVFVTRVGDRATNVEVVSKPVGGVITFPPDWPGLLLGDIEAELAEARKPR